MAALHTRDVALVLVKRWASVVDDGPTLNQHWDEVFFCWDANDVILASIFASLYLNWAVISLVDPATARMI